MKSNDGRHFLARQFCPQRESVWKKGCIVRSSAIGVLGALILAYPSLADTFRVTTNLSSVQQQTSVGQSTGGADPYGSGTFNGFAFAGPFAGVTGNASGTYLGQTSTEAVSVIDDVLITGPGSTVMATITLPFVSSLSGEYETAPFGNSGFGGGLSFGASFNGAMFGPISFGTTDDNFSTQPMTSPSTFPSGDVTFSVVPTFGVTLLAGPGGVAAIHDTSFQFDGALQFTISLPVGTPFQVSFDVQGSCGAGGGNSGINANCAFDAYDPFGFAPGYSAFNLPPGYSVNAPSIGLVDGVVPAIAGVPEPSSVVPVGSGLSLLFALRRKLSFFGRD